MHLLLDEHVTKENGHSSMHLKAGSNKYVPLSFFPALWQGSFVKQDRESKPTVQPFSLLSLSDLQHSEEF